MSMFHELMMKKKEQIMYATIKGTLTESPEGVFSGFSLSNYLSLSNLALGTKDFEFKIVFVANAVESRRIFASYDSGAQVAGIILYNTGQIQLKFSDGVNEYFINSDVLYTTNTKYYVIAYRKGTEYGIKISTDNVNWATKTSSSSTVVNIVNNTNFDFGVNKYSNTNYFNGSIDLSNSYIKINGTKYNLQAVVGYTVVGSPTITDGVVSGFSSSDYVTISQSSGTVNSIEIITKVQDIASTITHTGLIIGLNGNLNARLAIGTNGRVQCNYRDIDNTTRYLSSSKQASEYNYIRVMFNTNEASLDVSTDGITWINEYTRTEKPNLENAFISCSMGYISNTYNSFEGSINMSKTSIKRNNKLWFNGQQA